MVDVCVKSSRADAKISRVSGAKPIIDAGGCSGSNV